MDVDQFVYCFGYKRHYHYYESLRTFAIFFIDFLLIRTYSYLKTTVSALWVAVYEGNRCLIK